MLFAFCLQSQLLRIDSRLFQMATIPLSLWTIFNFALPASVASRNAHHFPSCCSQTLSSWRGQLKQCPGDTKGSWRSLWCNMQTNHLRLFVKQFLTVGLQCFKEAPRCSWCHWSWALTLGSRDLDDRWKPWCLLSSFTKAGELAGLRVNGMRLCDLWLGH